MPDAAPNTRRTRRPEAQAARPARGQGKRAAPATKAKIDVTVRELMFTVSRVAAGFEAMLKTKEPALSLSQWAILEIVSREDGAARPSQVARKLGFSRQLVRQAAKKPEALDLVAKAEPEEGKKAVGLTLSDAGRKALADIGASTDTISDALKADKRGGGINLATRTLKGLSAAMPTNAPKEGKKRTKTSEAVVEAVSAA